MHSKESHSWKHHHLFNLEKKHNERKTRIVVIITAMMMVAEIVFGWISNSMALLTDGWHMGTHAFALGISLMAYSCARKYAKDSHFTFGTWKIEILGAYSSAIVLGLVGLMMIYTSIERLIHPLTIHYNQALLIALIGLVVNAVCALILNAGSHAHAHHGNDHQHAQSHHHHDQMDLNLKSAYLHVIADAMTSVLALVALLGAKYWRFDWLDPLIGIVGALLILQWAGKLLKDTASILLDHEGDSLLSQKIITSLESDGDTLIADLHLLKVADQKNACIIALVTSQGRSIEEYRERLHDFHELAHLTIEINQCPPTDKQISLCRL